MKASKFIYKELKTPKKIRYVTHYFGQKSENSLSVRKFNLPADSHRSTSALFCINVGKFLPEDEVVEKGQHGKLSTRRIREKC